MFANEQQRYVSICTMDGMNMIEFKGTYSHESKTDSSAVLVQYDGVLLHIWHLSDPFYRMLTSDVFHLGYSRKSKRHRIRLPNGACIDTEDSDAVSMLRKSAEPMFDSTLDRQVFIRGLLALLLSIITGIGAWAVFR